MMLDGLLVCERHAHQLEAQNKIDLLRGIISCLDLCLSNLALRRDTNLVGLLRAERADAASGDVGSGPQGSFGVLPVPAKGTTDEEGPLTLCYGVSSSSWAESYSATRLKELRSFT